MVKPPRHRDPLDTAGKTLNEKLIEKIVEANVEKIAVRAESLVGRRTATRIVDTESGEVLVQTNTEINSQILSQIMGFFFQAEDGIRDVAVTGVQTCALPI